MKFRERIARFMAGRNGVDQLGQALLWVYILLVVLGLIWKGFSLLAFLAVVILFWRMLSKNLYKRQAENRKYLTVLWKVKNFFSLQKRKFTDRKTHRYRTCPYCKATLRLPNKKGKHTVNCPKCHKDFEVKI